MRFITKTLSVILIMGMLMSFIPVVSNAAVTARTLPSKEEFSTEEYIPADADGYTVTSGSLKVKNGRLTVSSTSGTGAFLKIDFDSVSSGTLIVEVDYYALTVQRNTATQGLVMMYDTNNKPVLGLLSSSRAANSAYYNTGTASPAWGKNVNNLNADALSTGALKNNAFKFEIDLDNKKWKVFQGTKQLQTRFKAANTAVGSGEAINVFPFIDNGNTGDISAIRIGLAGDDTQIDNIKIYKKLSTTQTATSYDMLLGETQQAGITVTPSTEKVGDLVWSSSNSSVATVSDTGLITAESLGSAVITAKSEFYGINYSYAVSVQDPATGIALDKEKVSICEGDTATLKVNSIPDKTTFRNLTWSSSDDNIATVSDGVVTGISKGSAKITATAEGKNGQTLTATAVINVIKPLTGLSISATETSLSAGERTAFTAVVAPADASEIEKKWRSGNHYIATVDQSGVVTAVGEGTTEIYVSASGFTASQSVTVTENKDDSAVRKPSLISFYTPTGYSFHDIADMEWAQSAVYSAVESGAINPDSETVFGAKRNIKRDEFVSVVVKTLGLTTKQGSAEAQEALKNFTDVPETNPYYAEIMKALELGIIQGVSETEFAPDYDITRQDMSVVVSNALKVASVKTEEGRLDFADKDSIAEYAQTSVRILSKMGIIKGKENNMFDPLANTTRAEVCVIVDRINNVR